ncbi:MAG: glyoxylate/hydroxypyruvate reductase A [Rhizobiaceae bacterium]|nr:glyoxylate/hydroxypyruvate reductase A [Rhizobiaceae bacterium]
MSNSPLLMAIEFDGSVKAGNLEAALGGRKVIDLNENPSASLEEIKYALVWKPDAELFRKLPSLEVLFSAGAGVDHIFQASNIPDIPIVRFVDHSLTTQMSEWVCLQCLMHLRRQRDYDRLQKAHDWKEIPQPMAADITVGIMGLGELGKDAASKLNALGFKVAGWSRSKKAIDNVDCYGNNELDTFLARTDILVGLLPFTPQTTGIYNRAMFEKLNRNNQLDGPVFINAGRGSSHVETDITACLRDKTLSAVSLDVFEIEPLPQDSPLWDFQNAILTPHSAAVTNINALGKNLARQLERYETGLPLEHVVDRTSGY